MTCQRRAFAAVVLFFAVLIPAVLHGQPAAPNGHTSWRFAVSGDSRNCGDIVMPAIAAGVKRDNPEFYWHLGDYRAIYIIDEDYLAANPKTTVIGYQQDAWPDFIRHQLAPFGELPVFLAMGNHETIPPKTRAEYIQQFADWLDTPLLQKQRLADDSTARQLKTYYHWIDHSIDFITLDNSSADQFDDNQLKWFQGVLQRDGTNGAIRTLVVGMHAALPDSLTAGHGMNDSAQETVSGRKAYQALLDFRNKTEKNVYVLASHSHFVMDNIYDNACHPGDQALPGWIIGTAGAVHYSLPADHGKSTIARNDAYGYLLATVAPDDTIQFEFKVVNENDVPQATVQEFTQTQVDWCFSDKNSDPKPISGPTCPVCKQ